MPGIIGVFGLTGAITASLLVYIMPGAFFLRLSTGAAAPSPTLNSSAHSSRWDEEWWSRRSAQLLIFVGVVVGVVSTISITYQMATAK